MRKAVYTVVTGKGYKLREDIALNKDWEMYCFTNDPDLTSPVWEIVPIENKGLCNRKLSRRVKILGHKYLPFYDKTVYIDTSFTVPKKLDRFIAETCPNSLTLMKHPKRDCIYDEFERIKKDGKEGPDILNSQSAFYRAEGYPQNNGLYAPGIMIRKRDLEVDAFMEEWWKQIARFSYRDIPSFSYTLWRNPIKFTALPFKETCRHFGRGKK
jgi:hypothetical protein